MIQTVKSERVAPHSVSKRRYLTLLEILIGMMLLCLASGLIGWNTYQAMQRKRMQAALDTLEARCFLCQRLALAMQSDWRGVLKASEEGWVLETFCLDPAKIRELRPLTLPPFTLFWEGQKVEEVAFTFFSSGQVFPKGTLLFTQPPFLRREWNLLEIFLRSEPYKNQQLGPIHPEDV